MRKFYSLLVATLMSVAASADETVSAVLEHTASSHSGSTTAYVSTVDSEAEYFNQSKMNSSTWQGCAYAEFSFELPANATVTGASLVWSATGTDRNAYGVDLMYVTDGTLDYSATGLGSGTAQVNLTATKILTQTITKGSTVTTNATSDVTDALKAIVEAGKSSVIFKWTNSAGSGNLVGKGSADCTLALSITYTTAKTSKYFVVRQLDAEHQVDTVKYTGVIVGQPAYAEGTDLDPFWKDGKKYVHNPSEGDIDFIAIDEDETKNYMYITVSEAPKAAYTIYDNVKSEVITSGEAYVGDDVKYYFPRYLLNEGTLYQSKEAYEFSGTFNATEGGVEETVVFSPIEEGTDAVFFAEAENIDGVERVEDGFTNIRMSNGAAGFANNATIYTFTEPGKYTITSSTRSGATSFTVNGEEVYNLSSTGTVVVTTSDEFTVTESGTALVATNQTAGKDYFDYVLIRKTGDVNYTEIKAVKDTVVIEKDPSFSLNNIVTITSSADWSQFEGFNLVKNAKLGIAAAGEGTDKATATYSESSVFDALPTFSTIGDYYVYVKIPVTYQDQSTEDAISDTLVVQVKDVYYLNVEENLPDTIKYLKGTDEDMKPMLSNYMTAVSDGVLSADMFIANAIEGVTKEDATYAGYGTEEDAKNAMSTPGAYFAYGVVTASYDDKDPLTYTTDTIVIVVSDPNKFEIETVLEYQEIANNATADEVKDFFAVYTANTAYFNLYIGVAKAENDEVDKADLSYDEYNADAFDQNFDFGTYYIYMRGLAAFENGEEATAKSDTVCLVVSEAVPADVVITDWTFDDNQSPSFSVETGAGSTNQDYSHNAVIGEEYDGNKFLNAWGDNNTNSTLTATITDEDLSEAGQWTLEFDFAGYSGCNKRAGTFSILDPNGQSIMSITDAADWQNTFSISDGSTIECYPCNRDTRLKNDCGNVLTAKYWHHFKLVGNSTGVKMTVSKYDAEGQLGDPIIVKSQVSATNATPSVFSLKAGSASSFAFDNLTLYYTTEEPEASPYVVKYMCGDEEIKPDANRSDEAGAEIILSPSDTENFTVEGQKYIYDSDDAEGKVVSAEEVVVVTVNFHKAALVDYSVYVDPNESGDYIFVYGGQNFEDETIKIGFPGRFEIDGVIYEGVKGESDDSKGFAKTVTLGKNNSFVFTVNETQTNNVVFFSEAENIEGLTLCDNGNTAIRSSMGASAYAESEDVTIATLPVGVYKIVSVACDAAGKNASAVFSYKAGDEVIFTQTCGAINWDEQTSEEFTVTEEGTEIKLVQGGSEMQGIDLVYIIKTGEYDPTAVDGVAENVEGETPVKFVKNGQLIIATGNKQFNAAGGQLK